MTDQDYTDKSVFYQHTGKLSIASKISYQVRQEIFDRFMVVMDPNPQATVLDIGVTSDTIYRESNFFEQRYPYKNRLACVGTEDARHLEKTFPGCTFKQVESGKPLPFADKTFDIVFSNAVVEHTGDRTSQKFFIDEACRVAKRVFITTPNRWFPIEHHTALPLLHYLPVQLYRSILRHTAYEFWADEDNLNLLTLQSFKACFPSNYDVTIEYIGIAPSIFKSNLVAWSR